MKRALLFGVILSLYGSVAQSQSPPKATPVKVHVFTKASADGLIDDESKNRARAVTTLMEEVVKPPIVNMSGDKKKAAARLAAALEKAVPIAVVPSDSSSDVTLEVVTAQKTSMPGGIVFAVDVELRRGDYATQFRQISGDVGIAAAMIAGDVKKWMSDNYDTITKAR